MTLALIIGLGACAIWCALLWVSDRRPFKGPWPPARGNWGTAIWAWGLTILIYIGLFQAWATPQGDWAVVIWVIAMTLSGIGTVIQSWAIVDLGMAGTSGWNVGLVTTGSYRYCRHPQYFGQALGFVGFAILLGHGVGWAIGLAAVATLFYASYVEDRAMAARQGDFAAYKARTPFVLPLGPR